MKKKFISILLAAALVAGLLCAPALAEGETGTGVFIAGIELEEGREYTNADFWPLVPAPTPDPDPAPTDEPSPLPTPTPTDEPGSSQDSTEIPPPSPAAAEPAANASAVYGGMTRSADSSDWNAKLTGGEETTYTLYIKDLSVMGVANVNYGAAICSGRSLTIVLEGVNSAIGADVDGGGAEGISAGSEIVIKGDGTLTATGGNADYGSSWGIGSDIVRIIDGATVIATGGTATYDSYGISSETTVTIGNGATVVATGGSTDGSSYGIRGYGVTIKNGATVIATGGNVSDEDSSSYGIDSPSFGITINSSTVVARGGTVGGAFSGDRKAVNGTVNLTDAKLAGGVKNEAEQGTPAAATATSLAIVPTAWTENELPEAEAGNTYNIDDDTYIVRPDACALEIKSDATIDAEGSTLLAVSLFEGDRDTAGIYSTASVTLKGNIIAVGGLTAVIDGSSSGFKADEGTVTIEGSLLAVGAGTCGYGYSGGAETTVKGTLTGVGVGVSGVHTRGLNLQNDLTVERGGAVVGYAGPVSGDGVRTAAGIHVVSNDGSKGIFAEGNITGVGAGYGLSGADPVDGGTYLGKQAAVDTLASPAEGYAFYDADGNIPANRDAEKYLTVGETYAVIFHMEDIMDEGTMKLDIPRGQSVSAIHADEVEGFTAMMKRSGYTFGGWYASDNEGETLADEKYDFTSEVTDEVHLYPKWTRVRSSSGGGSAAPAKAPCPQDQTCPIAAFEDADPKGWYHDGIHYCIEQELMIGTGETEFAPHRATSRAMIVTILHRLEGEPEATTTGTFTDVADGLWYSEAIEWAAAKGIVEGNGAGAFAPEADLTREQMATILYRYAQYLGEGFTGAWAFRLDFADLGEMSEWANEGVSWCVMNGLLEGDDKGLLRPGDGLERCEMATLLYRLCENILK